MQRLNCRYPRRRVNFHNILSLACALSSEKWAVQWRNEVRLQCREPGSASGGYQASKMGNCRTKVIRAEKGHFGAKSEGVLDHS